MSPFGTTASFDSADAIDRVTGAATAKHVRYDGLCRQANMSFRDFGLSTMGGACSEAMDVIATLRAQMCERFGRREGQLLAQQAIERISVACMRGVGAQLLDAATDSAPMTGPTSATNPTRPEVDGGLLDKGYRLWQEWAREHGFEPAPPTGIAGTLGVRILTHVEPPEQPMRLVWEDQEHGCRVFAR